MTCSCKFSFFFNIVYSVCITFFAAGLICLKL